MLLTWYSSVFPRFIGGVFFIIACIMLADPHFNLIQDGIRFDSFTTAGRAEVI